MSLRDSVRYRRLVPGDFGGARLVETARSVGRRCFHASVCVWHCVSVSRLDRVVADDCVCFSYIPSWCRCLAWLHLTQPLVGASEGGQYHSAGLVGTMEYIIPLVMTFIDSVYCQSLTCMEFTPNVAEVVAASRNGTVLWVALLTLSLLKAYWVYFLWVLVDYLQPKWLHIISIFHKESEVS